MLRICARTGDDGLHLGLLGRELVEIGVLFAISGVDFLQPRFGSEHIPHTGFNAFAHGLGGVKLRLLWQVTNSQIGHRDGLALNLLVHTRHDFQQGRFTRAIGSQHANLGTGEEAERDVFENEALGRHHLADAVH